MVLDVCKKCFSKLQTILLIPTYGLQKNGSKIPMGSYQEMVRKFRKCTLGADGRYAFGGVCVKFVFFVLIILGVRGPGFWARPAGLGIGFVPLRSNQTRNTLHYLLYGRVNFTMPDDSRDGPIDRLAKALFASPSSPLTAFADR